MQTERSKDVGRRWMTVSLWTCTGPDTEIQFRPTTGNDGRRQTFPLLGVPSFSVIYQGPDCPLQQLHWPMATWRGLRHLRGATAHDLLLDDYVMNRQADFPMVHTGEGGWQPLPAAKWLHFLNHASLIKQEEKAA